MNIKNKSFKIPHTMVILAFVAFLMAIFTHILPSGQYARVANTAGRMVVDPNSFHYVKSSPVGIMGFLTSFPRGFAASASIIAMTLFSGAGFAVLRKIGLIDIGIEHVAAKFEGRGIRVIPFLMFLFATIDAFIGMPELCMVYIPIVMPLMMRLGFDSITSTATVMCASITGFTSALTNPFTVGISQKICELPLYSGWEFRVVIFFVMITVGILYVTRYGRKVLANPTCSSMYEEDKEKRKKFQASSKGSMVKMPTRLKIAAYYVILIFIIMLVGVIKMGWDMPEMSAIFICIGVGAGLIGGLESREICISLAEGAKDVLLGAIFIALARATAVIMSDGVIIDTIVHGMQNFLMNLPTQVTVVGLLLVVTILNFFIISGSGKAVVLFPVLTPLADVCGITRQTAVVAFQFGDGFTNFFWPTGGTLMACLGIAGIPWNKWVKFYFPLLVIWYTFAIAFIIIAQTIKLGPF
jgi:uncharacterized ion transporter superfamily protein YfcC